MPQFKERADVVLADCPQQRLHSDLQKGPWNEENEELPVDTETKSQVAVYFAMVSGGIEMPLRICEGSNRIFCAVHRSWVKESRIS